MSGLVLLFASLLSKGANYRRLWGEIASKYDWLLPSVFLFEENPRREQKKNCGVFPEQKTIGADPSISRKTVSSGVIGLEFNACTANKSFFQTLLLSLACCLFLTEHTFNAIDEARPITDMMQCTEWIKLSFYNFMRKKFEYTWYLIQANSSISTKTNLFPLSDQKVLGVPRHEMKRSKRMTHELLSFDDRSSSWTDPFS